MRKSSIQGSLYEENTFNWLYRPMNHTPVDKVKDRKIHVFEYALLSLIVTPVSVSMLIDRIQIKIGLDHKHFDPSQFLRALYGVIRAKRCL